MGNLKDSQIMRFGKHVNTVYGVTKDNVGEFLEKYPEIGYLPVGIQSEDEFKLALWYSTIYGYALQALEAMESLQENVRLISGGPGDKALELAKNHLSEYAAEALCALKEPYDWWEDPLNEMVTHILQKGANNGHA